MQRSRPICLILAVLILGATGFLTTGCITAYKKSVGSDTAQVFRRIYLTDFNTAWQAVIDSLQNSPIDVKVPDGGYLQTKWTDNTDDKNFVDSFAGANAYLKAQYRFRITVAKGFYNGKPCVKVSVQKDQVVQRDVLEGWKPVETDSYDENTLLYRIGRIVLIKTKLAELEEERAKREMENTQF